MIINARRSRLPFLEGSVCRRPLLLRTRVEREPTRNSQNNGLRSVTIANGHDELAASGNGGIRFRGNGLRGRAGGGLVIGEHFDLRIGSPIPLPSIRPTEPHSLN